MKRFLISAVFLTAFSFSFAQQDTIKQETWYHDDFATSHIYGVNTQNAYKFLESKGLKPTPVVVGVIDSGVQIDHPAIVNNIWTNKGEIPNNGIDDDHNGYIDDVHGWDFIGGKNGDVDVDALEVTRVVARYHDVFEGPDSAKNKENQAKMPDQFKMYMKAKGLYDTGYQKAKTNYTQYQTLAGLADNIPKMLGDKTLTQENLSTLQPVTMDDQRTASILAQLLANDPAVAGKTGVEVKDEFMKQIDQGLKYYKTQYEKQYNLSYNPRSIVGDDYSDLTQRDYGNNDVEGPDAMHGTHVSGIIAGVPQGGVPQYGVAYKVAKIMSVRTIPDGDERDKDVANAIFYAVDNGAKILNMSFGKPISPDKQRVWEAMKYAEKKGVLMVKAAGNDNQDIAVDVAYPTNFKSVTDEKPFVNNMIVIGASTDNNADLRASFSNYNRKMVDVFAPGAHIFSSVPKNKYEYLDGTSMATPMVVGAAAILKAYMPDLTPAQMIEALVNSANKSAGSADLGLPIDKKFADLSRAGGVIDAEKAAEYAYNNFYHKTKNIQKPVRRKKPAVRKKVRR